MFDDHRLRAVAAAALAAGLALAVSCASKPAAKPAAQPATAVQNDLAGAPDWISRGCAAYWADAPSKGVCGVGSASGSRNIALTISAAEGRGRTAIARSLGTKVQAMLKDYQATTTGGEEFGTAAADEQHIVDVSKQLTDGSLRGAERRDLWVSPSGVVYALMVLDLEKFQGAVFQMKSLSESVRRHVATQAEKEFDGPEAPSAAAGGDSEVAGGPLALITQAEIDEMLSQPGAADTTVAWGRSPDGGDGPVIQIDSPQNGGVYEGPFPIRVAFLAGPEGDPVDMESLKLEYKVAWGIDITDKVRAYIDGTKIDVAESELPAGEHTVEILIEDTRGRRSTQLFTITVR